MPSIETRYWFLLLPFLVLVASTGCRGAELWDYISKPVTATDPDAPPSWDIAAQYAFDGYGGSVRPGAIAHAWARVGTPSPTSPFVCIVDYKQPVAISKFVNYFHIPEDKDHKYNDPLEGPMPFSSVRVYRSPDGINWTLAGTFENQPADFPQILALAEAVAARYYKLEVTRVATAYYGLRSYEIESYTGPIVYKTDILTSPPRTGAPVVLRTVVRGTSSYDGLTAHVAPGPGYLVLVNDVPVDSAGQAQIQVLPTRPGRVGVNVELRAGGQILDRSTAYLPVATRITLTGVTVEASGVHGTAVNSGAVSLSPTLTWQEESVSLGPIAPGGTAAFNILGTPRAGLQCAEISVEESQGIRFTYRKPYMLSALPAEGEIRAQGLTCAWSVSTYKVTFHITPAGSGAPIESVLAVKLDGVGTPLKVGEATPGSLLLRSEISFGLLELNIEPVDSALKVTCSLISAGVDYGTKFTNILNLSLTTPSVTNRFLPGWLCTSDDESRILGACYTSTRMAALSQPSGTMSIVPSVDRCNIGIAGNAATVDQRFAGTPIVVHLTATAGDWFEAFKYVVNRIYRFSAPQQYRPLTEVVSGEMRYLVEEGSIWSPAYQTLRSFPNADYFFNFYGAPYAVPALYTRYLTTGDTTALQRALGTVNWLCNSAIRSTNPATRGAFYSQFIQGIGPCDQAHNVWIEPHASGTGAWTLLYYWNASGRADSAVLNSARAALDWLIQVQNPNGGWVYAYLPDGTPVTDQEDSGNIWNIWALYRMWKYTGEQKYLNAATRGRDWFANVWVPKRMGRGYWEDGSGANGQVGLSAEVHEFAIAAQVFAEMGDTALAVECAKIAISWVWTRTIDARDYFNSYGHVHEQLGWPPATYLAPVFGMAAHTVYLLTGDPFFASFAEIPKVIGWWTERASGSGFWALEGTQFVPLEGPLTIQYWVDWITAQQASICYKWLVSEMNRRCRGKIAVDPETLKGTVLGEPGAVFLRLYDSTIVGRLHNQINWLGYKLPQGYVLAIMNHDEATDVYVSVNLAALGLTGMVGQSLTTADGSVWQTDVLPDPAHVTLSIPAGGTAIIAWRPVAVYETIGAMKKQGLGARGRVTGVVTRWLGFNPLFVIESPDRSSGILVFYPPGEGGPRLFDPGDVVEVSGTITSSADMLVLAPDSLPVKIGHGVPIAPLGARLADLQHRGIRMDGLLVRVSGRVVDRDFSGNPSLAIDDGSGIPAVRVYTWGRITLPEVGHYVVLNAIACRLNGAPYLDVWYPEDVVLDIVPP